MAEIKVATDATFEALVINNDKPTVVDFWATWCGPCKMVAPEMEKLAAKYDGTVDVVKVDVDANPGLSRQFNIMSIPTIAFFRPDARFVSPENNLLHLDQRNLLEARAAEIIATHAGPIFALEFRDENRIEGMLSHFGLARDANACAATVPVSANRYLGRCWR